MPQERPFDARLQLIDDRHSPEPSWRTVSLVTALREFMQRDPDAVIPCTDEMCGLVTKCADELTDRGLDADALVRYGLFPEVLAGAIFPVVGSWLDLKDVFDDSTPSGTQQQAWAARLEPILVRAGLPLDQPKGLSEPDLAKRLLSVVATAVIPWVLSAPLADLIALKPPPSLDDLAEQANGEVRLFEEYRWAVDRFSVTRLDDWKTTSLHLEYQWMVGQQQPPCASGLMADRTVARTALEQEIARRAALPASRPEHPEIASTLAVRMQAQATRLLSDGRYREAATLFEFALSQDPQDAAASNNLGFCLIPVDPRSALHYLERSASLGYLPLAINGYNRVLCLKLLGRSVDALALADQLWNPVSQEARVPATLWVASEEGGLILEHRADARSLLIRLAKKTAEEAGIDDRVEVWSTRLAA